jgi:hypothetical protein
VIIRRVSLTALVVVGLLAGAMCTSASAATVPPSEWAPAFCTAFTNWQTTISQKSDDMSTALDGAATAGQSPQQILGTARDQIASFLGDMVDATDEAASAIKDAGSPSTPNGAKIAAVFVTGFKAISKKFAQVQDEAQKLPTTSVQKFKVKGKQLGVSLSAYGDSLSKDFSVIGKLDKGKKLEAAVKAAPECASIA